MLQIMPESKNLASSFPIKIKGDFKLQVEKKQTVLSLQFTRKKSYSFYFGEMKFSTKQRTNQQQKKRFGFYHIHGLEKKT